MSHVEIALSGMFLSLFIFLSLYNVYNYEGKTFGNAGLSLFSCGIRNPGLWSPESR